MTNVEKPSQSSPLISVVICTYNRAQLLKAAIESVLAQESDPGSYELLIVDNHSNDNTRKVVDDFSKVYPQVRYIFEENQGLSFARNRGWKEAKGEYVIYLDDDGKAQPGWLAAAHRTAKKYHPGLFGGPFYACYAGAKPRWFKDEYGSNTYGAESRPLKVGEYLTGGNLAILRSLLEDYGGFRTELGMKGSQIGFGEETAFQMLVQQQRPDLLVFYEPQMAIWHLVKKERMDLNFLAHSAFSDGRYSFLVFSLPQFPASFSFLSKMKSFVKSTLRFLSVLGIYLINITLKMIIRDRKRYPCRENYFVERCLPIIRKIGWNIEDIQQIFRVKTTGFSRASR